MLISLKTYINMFSLYKADKDNYNYIGNISGILQNNVNLCGEQ